ncbi:MAG: UDP-N-acetylmuramate dehydrogenase [Sporomusaceae bacterium]|nr:UDP-N-acetylmuramate dehydrogenase [Sporomusaceae bacterium]
MENYRANQKFRAELQTALVTGKVLFDEPMKDHTTFQIGGPADYFILPGSQQEVAEVMRITAKHQIPVTVIGNGSNLLVRDGGIAGAVVALGDNMAFMQANGDTITVGAGALLADVAKFTATQKLSGAEFAIGIPGTIGGAVFMNAGAYDGEIKDIVFSVSAVTLDGQEIVLSRQELAFAYRHSIFQENHAIICEIVLSLQVGDSAAILAKMAELTARREAKQPLDMPSAGSTFKRPPGHFAGTLIEQTGLKGFQIGGAAVSEKHAGFVVNCGGATATDVLNLIAAVQQKVQAAHGILLQPEVRVIGRP